jgi:hypothetical protein
MSPADFDKLVEKMRALDPAEQLRLRDFLDALLSIPPGSPIGEALSEDQFEEQLVQQGIISVPPQRTDFSSVEKWQPVEIQGKPLSETIIEERR